MSHGLHCLSTPNKYNNADNVLALTSQCNTRAINFINKYTKYDFEPFTAISVRNKTNSRLEFAAHQKCYKKFTHSRQLPAAKRAAAAQVSLIGVTVFSFMLCYKSYHQKCSATPFVCSQKYCKCKIKLLCNKNLICCQSLFMRYFTAATAAYSDADLTVIYVFNIVTAGTVVWQMKIDILA